MPANAPRTGVQRGMWDGPSPRIAKPAKKQCTGMVMRGDYDHVRELKRVLGVSFPVLRQVDEVDQFAEAAVVAVVEDELEAELVAELGLVMLFRAIGHLFVTTAAANINKLFVQRSHCVIG